MLTNREMMIPLSSELTRQYLAHSPQFMSHDLMDMHCLHTHQPWRRPHPSTRQLSVTCPTPGVGHDPSRVSQNLLLEVI